MVTNVVWPLDRVSDPSLTQQIDKLPLVILVELVSPKASDMVLASGFVELEKVSLHVVLPSGECSNLFDLRWCELEGHRSQIVTQPLLFGRSSDRDDVLIDTPP